MDSVTWDVFATNAAENYEAYLVPSIFGPFAEGLVQVARLRPGEWALDVASGTGIIARLAARQVGERGKVIGLDLNPSMLQVAERVSDVPQISWLQANADSMPLPNGGFDVVFCQQGLQFFPDRGAALREMHRVLKPGGRLVVSVWADIGAGFAALSDGLRRHVGADAGAALAKGPASLTDPDELMALVKAAGFAALSIRKRSLTVAFPTPAEFVLRYVAGTPLAAAVQAVDNARRAALLKDASECLRNHMVAGELQFLMLTNVLTGHKKTSATKPPPTLTPSSARDV